MTNKSCHLVHTSFRALMDRVAMLSIQILGGRSKLIAANQMTRWGAKCVWKKILYFMKNTSIWVGEPPPKVVFNVSFIPSSQAHSY